MTICESQVSNIRLLTISLCVIAVAIILTGSKSFGDQIDDMRNVIGRVCPANPTDYPRVSGNAECDPDRSTSHGCDQKFSASSPPWQACYAEIEACRNRVDQANKVVADYNAWMNKCRSGTAQPRPKESSSVVPKGSAVPADNPLARAREAAKKKAEEAEQKNEAAANQVKSLYKEKLDELKAEKAREAADAEAVRQNQAKIREQMETEKTQPKEKPPLKQVQCFAIHEYAGCFNTCLRYYGHLGESYCRNGCTPGEHQHCVEIP
jgi:hypothetical protein